MTRVFNFSAGPCTLPLEVLEDAGREFVDYRGLGFSLMEISHRSRHYEEVHFEALALARELSGAPDDFDVMFIQGGASLQFAMVPLNLLPEGGMAGYVLTGVWARRAFEDAGFHGRVYAAWDGSTTGYTRAPSPGDISIKPGTRYLHITSNETINGIRYPEWPRLDVPLVADVSSEFFSRPVPWDRFDIVYGGVQKNLGPAGMALVFARRTAIEASPTNRAAYLQYETHARSDSLFNTPPVFQIWMTGKVLAWMKERGGTAAIEKDCEEKALILYAAIDGSDGFYRSPVEEVSRSLTNVVFRLPSEDLEARFVAEAEQRGLLFLRGHRSVGGCRASLYAAMPLEGVEALAAFMDQFRSSR
ncbi:MAG TPA: 3-phosphoserine/phosphohydroxythreonine transaminase [Acidimicrobiia bacterium]